VAKVPEEHRDIHAEADKREPPMERAFSRGARELADAINLDELELAIGTGDVDAVMELFPEELVTGSLEDLAELIGKAWLEGNEIGATELNDVLVAEAEADVQ
jgi:hypothetical protein